MLQKFFLAPHVFLALRGCYHPLCPFCRTQNSLPINWKTLHDSKLCPILLHSVLSFADSVTLSSLGDLGTQLPTFLSARILSSFGWPQCLHRWLIQHPGLWATWPPQLKQLTLSSSLPWPLAMRPGLAITCHHLILENIIQDWDQLVLVTLPYLKVVSFMSVHDS